VVIAGFMEPNVRNGRSTLDGMGDLDLLALARGVVSSHLPISMADNCGCSLDGIVDMVLAASTLRASIHHVYLCSDSAVNERTVRYHLSKLTVPRLEEALNLMLKERMPRELVGGSYIFAADLTLIPYHGEAYREAGELLRSKAKSGTTWFHAYASIYLTRHGRRYTLAVKYVRQGDELADVASSLVEGVRSMGLRVKRLLLDKGFFTVKVINRLKEMRIPFIIPAVCRGRGGGLRRLLKGGRSYSTTYTMTSIEDGTASFKVNIALKYANGKYGRSNLEYFAYATYRVDIPVADTYEEYRKRFGVETSYRIMNSSRARTSSRNPALRLLYVGVSFLLQNIWVSIKWAVSRLEDVECSYPRITLVLTKQLDKALGFPSYVVDIEKGG